MCRILLFLTICLNLFGELRTRYVLASEVVVTDLKPDQHFNSGQTLVTRFQDKFTKAFPNEVLRLDPEHMIGPDDRVIAIVPHISVVRMSHRMVAGSIHRFETVIAGDLSAVDPWTQATLYAATKMVTGTVDLGGRATGSEDYLQQAYQETSDRWLDATISQLKEKLAPFVLEGGTLQLPESARNAAGGIWPFGSDRGVRRGSVLAGPKGQFARVEAVYPKFAVIRDPADSRRLISRGEQYRLTLVEKPSARPEPRVESTWVDESPEGPLNSDGYRSILDSYLAKSAGLEVLPPVIQYPPAHAARRRLAEYIARYSRLAEGQSMSIQAETLVRRAQENPEWKVQSGVLESYHGERRKPDGTLEHYYRISLAAAIYRRDSDETPMYPLDKVVRHSEELAEIEMSGVRQTDVAANWVTVFRNGLIHLAEKTDSAILSARESGTSREATVGPDKAIVWPSGKAPSPTTPLTWLHPGGEVQSESGESLGRTFLVREPSQGFLNPAVLPNEKVEAGDRLRFRDDGPQAQLVGFRIAIQENDASAAWIVSRNWLLRLAANQLQAVCQCQPVPLEDGQGKTGVNKVIVLAPSKLGVAESPGGWKFTGEWRLRVLPSLAEDSGTPIWKAGLASEPEITVRGLRLTPPDIAGLGLQYVTDALVEVASLANRKGLANALSN